MSPSDGHSWRRRRALQENDENINWDVSNSVWMWWLRVHPTTLQWESQRRKKVDIVGSPNITNPFTSGSMSRSVVAASCLTLVPWVGILSASFSLSKKWVIDIDWCQGLWPIAWVLTNHLLLLAPLFVTNHYIGVGWADQADCRANSGSYLWWLCADPGWQHQ